MSQPFRYDVEVLCAKAAVPIDKMVGSQMTIHLALKKGGTRHFNGYVTDFSLRGVVSDRFVFAVTLRPWLYPLSHRVNCRVHRGTALEIVKKPRMMGVQTAIVVGGPKKDSAAKTDAGPPSAAPQEIDIDEYGRVKVRFHWDPDPDETGQNSCRVRVSQGWAGMNFGSNFHPRIGQEVIVDFIDGDPDLPIIVGRVHGFENQPSYTSPTQGGVKTHSTQGGSIKNVNEIRFEDKLGSEELFIQAEKTQTTTVKESQSISVGGNQSTAVSGHRDTHVIKKDTQRFDDHRDVTVSLTDKLAANNGSGTNVRINAPSVSITGAQEVTVKSDATVKISAPVVEVSGET